MGTNRWIARAPAVAQITTLTVGGTIEEDDVFAMTVGGVTLSVVAGSTTASTVAATIATAWAALDAAAYPQFAEIQAQASGATVILTHRTPGVPFIVSLSTTEDGGGEADDQTFQATETQAASGPNHWDDPANWSLGTVPTDGDDVVFDAGDTASGPFYGLDQSAVTLDSLTFGPEFRGRVGLPRVNPNRYFEYRPTELSISADVVTVNSPTQRIKLNLGSNAAVVNVNNTGTSDEEGRKTVTIRGSNASNELNVTKGSVALSQYAGDTAQFPAVRIGYQQNQIGDSDVFCGADCTLGTITKTGGSLEVHSAVTTLVQSAGEAKIQAGAVSTLTIRGGDVRYNSTGTLTTASVSGEGHLDFDQDLRAKTVTNPIEVYGPNARVSDANRVVSGMVVDLNETDSLANIRRGINNRVTFGTPA